MFRDSLAYIGDIMSEQNNSLVMGLVGILVVVIIVATVAIPVVQNYVDGRTIQADQNDDVVIGSYRELTITDNMVIDFANRTVDGVAFPKGAALGIWTDAGYVIPSFNGSYTYVGTYNGTEVTRVTLADQQPTVDIQAGVVTVNSTDTQVFTFTKGYVSDPNGNLKSLFFKWSTTENTTIYFDQDKEVTFVSPFGTNGAKVSTPFSFKGALSHDGARLLIKPIGDVGLSGYDLNGASVVDEVTATGALKMSGNIINVNDISLFNESLWLTESTTYTVKDTSPTPMSLIPIMLVLSVIMGAIGLFYTSKRVI